MTEIWQDVITPERAAKGDLQLTYRENPSQKRQYISAASVRDNRLLTALIERGILDDYHGYYAMVFTDTWRAFRLPLEHTGNRLYAGEHFGFDHSDGMFSTLYLKICRGIGKQNERGVKSAIQLELPEITCREDWQRVIRHLPLTTSEYATAFHALVRTIDMLRKDPGAFDFPVAPIR